MPRRWLTLLAGIVIATASAGAALACSCVGYSSAKAQFETVEVAFVGKVESETTDGPGGVRTRFSVVRTLKGAALPERTIAHAKDDGGNCGINYEVGQTVLVFAGETPLGLTTSSCSAPQFPQAAFEALKPDR